MRIKRRINWTKIKLNIYNRVKSTNLLPSFASHQKHRLRDRQSQWKNSHMHANRVTDCQDSKIAFIHAYYWCLLHLIAFCSHPKAIHVASWDYTQNVHPLNVPSTTTKPQCHESNPGTIDSQRVIVFFKNHATPILEPGSTHPRAEPFLLRIWGRNKLLDCLGMDMLNFGEMFRTFPREFVQLPGVLESMRYRMVEKSFDFMEGNGQGLARECFKNVLPDFPSYSAHFIALKATYNLSFWNKKLLHDSPFHL